MLLTYLEWWQYHTCSLAVRNHKIFKYMNRLIKKKFLHVLTCPFCSFSVFKSTDELIMKLKSSLLPTEKEERQGKTEKKTERERASNLRDPLSDPLLIPTRGPPRRHPPDWWTFIASFLSSCKLYIGFQRWQLFKGIVGYFWDAVCGNLYSTVALTEL